MRSCWDPKSNVLCLYKKEKRGLVRCLIRWRQLAVKKEKEKTSQKLSYDLHTPAVIWTSPHTELNKECERRRRNRRRKGMGKCEDGPEQKLELRRYKELLEPLGTREVKASPWVSGRLWPLPAPTPEVKSLYFCSSEFVVICYGHHSKLIQRSTASHSF